MKLLIVGIGALMILATAIPLVRKDDWWVRIFDFPRLQIAILTAAVIVAYVLFLNPFGITEYAFIAALLLCLLYQAFMIFPYTPLARKQVQQSVHAKKESTLSLLFSNVLMDNRNAARLKQIIREFDPDIVVTAETDSWWQEQLKELERTYSYTVQQPLDNCYGMLLHSRLELVNPEIKFLVQDDIPSIHTRVRLPAGTEVELRCLHPRPPVPQEHPRSTERDAELLIVGKEVKGKDDPVVVLGDLNDVAWSRTTHLFQKISGLLDPRIGRGFYHTFNAKYPFIRFPLDHFFHSKHFRLVELRRLPYIGSDHFPVSIRISYEPEARHQHEEPEADQSDHKEANEKIDEAR